MQCLGKASVQKSNWNKYIGVSQGARNIADSARSDWRSYAPWHFQFNTKTLGCYHVHSNSWFPCIAITTPHRRGGRCDHHWRHGASRDTWLLQQPQERSLACHCSPWGQRGPSGLATKVASPIPTFLAGSWQADCVITRTHDGVLLLVGNWRVPRPLTKPPPRFFGSGYAIRGVRAGVRRHGAPLS